MNEWVIGLVGAIIGSILGSIFTFILKLKAQKISAQTNLQALVIEQYEKLLNSSRETHEKAMQLHQIQFDSFSKDVNELKFEHSRCLADTVRLTKVVSDLQAQLELIQDGYGPDIATVTADVVCDENGNITDWDAGASFLFEWHRQEMMGKPITNIMADTFVGPHKSAFDKVINSDDKRPRHGIIKGIARSKSGKEFPVAIVLSSWTTLTGKTRFGATIRKAIAIEA